MTVERLFNMTIHKSIKRPTLLFLGFGYTASYIKELLLEKGFECYVLSTRQKQTLPPEQLSQVTHILSTSPPVDTNDLGLKLYKDVIINQTPHLRWLGYLSATSVYGDHKGGLVTEETPCTPQSDRGQQRLKIERKWQQIALQYNLPLHIFRLSGIYGKGRSTINDVKSGNGVNIIKPNHFTNRIYVKDIANLIHSSMCQPTPLEIFNLSDDLPASSSAVNDYISFLLDKPLLPKIPYENYKHLLTPKRKSFHDECKIVSNKKIKQRLSASLLYPSYREGIADILMHELMYKNAQIH